MTPFDGELPPPFEIVEPAEWRAPIVFNSPHSGSVYPTEFLNASRIDLPTLRRSEDAYVEDLFAGAASVGAPLLKARFPRAYLDVNREPYELDPDIKIMFITGFAAVALNSDSEAPKNAKVLSKPVHLRELVSEVNKMLAA